MVMRKLFRLLLFTAAVALLLGSVSEAQPVKPVFTTTSLDGQLIGLETDLQFGIWKPIAALAYGLNSGHFRYMAGLMLATGFDLPGVGGRLGDFSAALVDWPDSPILGREGQSGMEVGWRVGNNQFSGFWGTLWPRDGEAPQVQYLSVDTLDTYQLPFDLRLSSSSNMIIGLVVANEKLFQSMTRTLTLSLGNLRLSGRYGMLENEAQLNGFEFTTGVRGIAQSLKGHEFWNATLERTFSMYESTIPLALPVELQAYLPASLPVGLQGAFFVQAGGATHPVITKTEEMSGQQHAPPNGSPSEMETEMLFSWGLSATFSIYEFRLRAELIFTQDGETRLNFSF